jgi:prevent-host-death family protein
MTRTTISQADLTNKTQEVVDRVHHGEVAIIESSGQAPVVLLDALDFRLLQALAKCAIDENGRAQEPEDLDASALRAYLDAQISLGKAAELLGLHRLELQERLHRLGVPLHLGPATLEEAWAEIAAARKID